MKENKLCVILLLFVLGCHLPTDSYNQLGHGYMISFQDNGWASLLDSNRNYVVEGNLVEFLNDSLWIVAIQKPGYVKGAADKQRNMSKIEKARYNRNLFHYWIVNKKELSIVDSLTSKRKNVYGPFSKKEYLQRRIDFHIPASLEFEDLSEYPDN